MLQIWSIHCWQPIGNTKKVFLKLFVTLINVRICLFWCSGKEAAGTDNIYALRRHVVPDITEMIRKYLRREDWGGDEQVLSQSLFTPNIWFVRNLLDFKFLPMRSSNGKSDPIVHFLKNEQHMELVVVTEEILCKCFSIYLTNVATLWFYRLETGSISS